MSCRTDIHFKFFDLLKTEVVSLNVSRPSRGPFIYTRPAYNTIVYGGNRQGNWSKRRWGITANTLCAAGLKFTSISVLDVKDA